MYMRNLCMYAKKVFPFYPHPRDLVNLGDDGTRLAGLANVFSANQRS